MMLIKEVRTLPAQMLTAVAQEVIRNRTPMVVENLSLLMDSNK